MACVTLKRSLDFDPLYSPSRTNKRRRCMPMHCSTTPEKKMREEEPAKPNSCFKESSLTPEQIANNLRDEIKRMKKRRQIVGPSSPGSAPSSPEPMMDTEQQMTGLGSNSPCSSPIASSSHHHHTAASSNNTTATVAQEVKEKPIFTLKQMTLIAERMCNERVEQVRQEFEEILQQKLSEQYDSFVKFIDHQIQRRFQESQVPSYLS
eukprot:TRINITY_DN1294_c0_g1_i8.p1 TRINITY_DN1294_c0_g1~~TRINITY_DN1294_c0_g1_i8.p1  ORF type:complete len:207 (-),score=62.26 TRINITY_DN1294_c0_g1_i8:196-816(-)